MLLQLAIAFSCICIISISTVDCGRFKEADQLEAAPNDLEYAFIIFRHGIRSPLNNIYGSDEEFLKQWPDGQGALSMDGKRLMVHVGRSLKTRYKNLVPEYTEDSVQLTSTLSARTTMSGYAVAAGMFPPTSTVIDELRQQWQPVPLFHGASYDKHRVFDEVIENTACPRYISIRDSIVSQEMTKMPQIYQQYLKEINDFLKEAKYQMKTIESLEDLFNIWDVLYMEELGGKQLDLPPKIMEKMTKIAQFRLWIRMVGKNDGEGSLVQYFAAPLLYQIVTEIVDQRTRCLQSLVQDGADSQRCVRLHLHGSHDLSVGALLWSLDDDHTYNPAPGDTLILEAYKDGRVELLLYSPLSSELKLKTLSLRKVCSGIGQSCSFEEFTKQLKRRSIMYSEKEWNRKCKDLDGVQQAEWIPIP